MTGIRKESASPFILPGERRVRVLELRRACGDGALEARSTLLECLLLLRDLLCHRVEDRGELRELVVSRDMDAVRELAGSEGAGGPLEAFQFGPQPGKKKCEHRHGKAECQRKSHQGRLLYRTLLSQRPGSGGGDLLIAAFDLPAHGLRKNDVGP